MASDEQETPENGPSRQSNIVHGDQISTGDISNEGALGIGSGATAIVNKYGDDATELAAKFLEIYKRIEQRQDDPNVRKDEISRSVKDIETEAGKENPNIRMIERWLIGLRKLAPDVAPLVAAALADPNAGAAVAVCKIAQKILERSNSG